MTRNVKYYVYQCGVCGKPFTTREAAEAEAERLNAEAEDELGVEVLGDGAAWVAREGES